MGPRRYSYSLRNITRKSDGEGLSGQERRIGTGSLTGDGASHFTPPPPF